MLQKTIIKNNNVKNLVKLSKQIGEIMTQCSIMESEAQSNKYTQLKIKIEKLKIKQQEVLSLIFKTPDAEEIGEIDEAISQLWQDEPSMNALEDATKLSIKTLASEKNPVFFMPIVIDANEKKEIDSKTLLKLEMTWQMMWRDQTHMPTKNISIESDLLCAESASKFSVSQLYNFIFNNAKAPKENVFIGNQSHSLYFLIIRPINYDDGIQIFNDKSIENWTSQAQIILSAMFKNIYFAGIPKEFHEAMREGIIQIEKLNTVDSIKNQISVKNYFPQELTMFISSHGSSVVKLRPDVRQIRISLNNNLGEFVAGRILTLNKWITEIDARHLLLEAFNELKIREIKQINKIIDLSDDVSSPGFYSATGWRKLHESSPSHATEYFH